MGYRLGIDLGTTFTTAAISREDSPGVWGTPEVITLSDHGAALPTVSYTGPAGETLIGNAAIRRAITDPDRVVRHVKARIGDQTPIVTGPSGALAAHDVAARFVAAVADLVAARVGGAPDAIALTHPASWGAHKKDLLRVALVREGLLGVHLVPEPEAAARAYARTGRLRTGATLAIYDLGGGTFDTALLRTEPGADFTLLGRPVGIANLGGVDFDDLVLAHVLSACGTDAAELAAMDLSASDAGALAGLRRECVEAKEALSADTDAVIPVVLADTTVRLTRAEFEALIDDRLSESLDAMATALDSAGLAPEDLDRILLVGGSARIPLITQRLSARFPRATIERDIDPKLAVVTGAVLALEPAPLPAPFPPVVLGTARVVDDLGPVRPAVVSELGWASSAAYQADHEADDEDTIEFSPLPAARRRRVPVALAALALLAGGGAGAMIFDGTPTAETGTRPSVTLEVAPLPGDETSARRPASADTAERATRAAAESEPAPAAPVAPASGSTAGAAPRTVSSSSADSTASRITTTRSSAATRTAVAPAPRPVSRPTTADRAPAAAVQPVPLSKPAPLSRPVPASKPAPLSRPATAEEAGSAEVGSDTTTGSTGAQDSETGSVETVQTSEPVPPAATPPAPPAPPG
ncbi:MAG: Hsp70 family protein [Sporichthyaceae bacterium]